MSEGVVAGRLEIPVESDTSGFKKELKSKVDAAAKEVTAEIAVEPQSKGLRKKFKDAVEKAAKNLDAEVGFDVSTKGLRKRLSTAVTEAAVGVAAEIGVKVDSTGLRERLEVVAKTAAVGVSAKIGVTVDKNAAARVAAELAAAAGDGVAVPFTGKDRTLPWWRRHRQVVQAEVDANPINVPFSIGGGGGGGGGKSPYAGRGAMKGLMFLSIASVIQPVIAALSGGIVGLLGMLSNLSTAVNTIAVVPTGLMAIVSAFGAMKMAWTDFTGDLKDMPKSMRKAAKVVRSFSKDWEKVRTSVKNIYWDGMAEAIKPVIKSYLPILRSGLEGSAQVMSNLSKTFLGTFGNSGTQAQVSNIFAQINGDGAETQGVLAHLGRMLQGFVNGLMHLMEAAGPLTERLASALGDMGDKFARLWDGVSEKNELAAFLDYAADKGAQAGRIIGDLWNSLAGFFRAGRPVSDSLLGSFEAATQRLSDWVNSPEGAARIAAWFEAMKPVAEAFGSLLVEVAKAIGRLAEDPNTANLLRQIETELLPALEAFFRVLGGTLGEQVIEALTNLARLMAEMGAAGGPLATVLGWLNDGLSLLGDFFEEHPETAKWLGTLIGALLGFNALKGLLSKTGVLTVLGVTLGVIAGGLDRLKNIGKVAIPAIGAGGAAAAAGSGPGIMEKLFSQQVYWKSPMPVYVVGGGLGGDGGTVIADGPDGKDGKGKGKGGKTSAAGKAGKAGKLGKFGKLGRGLTVAGTGIAAGGKGLLSGIGRAGSAVGRAATGGVRAVGRGIGTVASSAGRGIASGARSLAGAADRGLTRAATHGVSGAMSSTFRAGASVGRGVGGAVTGAARGVSGAVTGAARGVGNAARTVGGGARTVKGAAATVGRGVSGAVRTVGNVVSKSKGAAGVRKIGSVIGADAPKVGGAIKGMFTGATAKAGGLVGSLFGKGTAKSVGSKIASGVGKVVKGGGPVGMVASLAGQLGGDAIKDGNGGLRDAGGGAMAGAASGAGIGAMIGSVVPGVGTAIGGVAGGLIGGVAGAVTSGADWDKVSTEIGTGLTKVKTTITTGVTGALDEVGVFKRDAEGKITGVDLTAPARYATDTLANALPEGVQTGLTNLGLFKRNADGTVSVDLAGAGGRAVNSLANALPPGVQTGLTHLGVFKRNADGTVRVDLSAAGSLAATTLASALPPGVTSALTALGVFSRDANGRVNVDLGGAGRKIINSLIAGFESKMTAVKNWFTGLTNKIPTWKGPAKRDATLLTNAGQLIMGSLVGGFQSGVPALRTFLGDLTDEIGGTSLGDLGVSGFAARSGLHSNGAGVVFEEGAIQVNNPLPEPASQSISSTLRRTGALGLAG